MTTNELLSHPEVQAFIKSLHDAAEKKDSLPRHIFADWLEEQGHDNAAKWQRLFAEQGKFPHRASEDNPIDWDAEISVDDQGNPVDPDITHDDPNTLAHHSPGWYPSGWKNSSIPHAAIPDTFMNALMGEDHNRLESFRVPGWDNEMHRLNPANHWNAVIYGDADVHPEAAALKAMDQIDYDKYNRPTKKDEEGSK